MKKWHQKELEDQMRRAHFDAADWAALWTNIEPAPDPKRLPWNFQLWKNDAMLIDHLSLCIMVSTCDNLPTWTSWIGRATFWFDTVMIILLSRSLVANHVDCWQMHTNAAFLAFLFLWTYLLSNSPSAAYKISECSMNLSLWLCIGCIDCSTLAPTLDQLGKLSCAGSPQIENLNKPDHLEQTHHNQQQPLMRWRIWTCDMSVSSQSVFLLGLVALKSLRFSTVIHQTPWRFDKVRLSSVMGTHAPEEKEPLSKRDSTFWKTSSQVTQVAPLLQVLWGDVSWKPFRSEMLPLLPTWYCFNIHVKTH